MLSVVALTEDIADEGLQRGQVGTIVENLAPGVYEVEFSDETGPRLCVGCGSRQPVDATSSRSEAPCCIGKLQSAGYLNPFAKRRFLQRIALYFLSISTVFSIGKASTVCPLPVVVVALNIEL
jgi:hypothetical protein